LFAQTTLNVAPDMQKDLGLDASMMNIAVAITALFSGIFIVVIGGLITSTFLSLLVIPVVFTYVDDLILRLQALLKRRATKGSRPPGW